MKAASALAELIDGLIEAGLKSNDLIIVGHSLGAHIAGIAGKKISKLNKIGSIVGLDPAAILFNVNHTELRLANTDAEYVQIIHTDTDGGRFALGIDKPFGHGMYNVHITENWYNICHSKQKQYFQVTFIQIMGDCSQDVYKTLKYPL